MSSYFCWLWHYPTPSLPQLFCLLLVKITEVHPHHSTVAKERKDDRIALAYTSSGLLRTQICSSGGKDSDSSVEKHNKKKLRGQLKGKKCVKTITCRPTWKMSMWYSSSTSSCFCILPQVLFCQRSPTYIGMTLQDSPLPRRLWRRQSNSLTSTMVSECVREGVVKRVTRECLEAV